MEIEPNGKDKFIEKNFFSQEIPIEQRASVFNSLFFNFKKNWKTSFGLMLILSVGIASLGLSENSSATIIGAMIIAPLGQTIVAFGGAIALGWRKEALQMLVIVVFGTIISIAVSFLFGIILNDGTPGHEVLIRTSPDLRDLGIALFAGTAGAYGYYRSEYSTVLAGVAIAVALIPPLCCCGLMMEEGHFILAKGSFLLFVSNLIGIAFSAILFFFLLGLKHTNNRRWFYAGTIIVILAGVSIFFPLAYNFNNFSSAAQFQSSIYSKADKVLSQTQGLSIIKDISINGKAAIIKVQPFPKSVDEQKRLTSELERAIGLQVLLQEPSK